MLILLYTYMRVQVTQEVVNRWGKRYIAQDWYIEVASEDLIHFNITDEDTKKDNKEVRKSTGKWRKSA